MMKTVYFLRSNGYDMLVSEDKEGNCKYLTENKYFPEKDEDIEAFVGSVEDDSSWEDDCTKEEIFTDGVEIIYECEKNM